MKLRTLCLLLVLCYLLPTAWAVDLADYPPDNPKDWGPSFQAAIDDLKDPDGGWDHESGGEIVVPKGRHRVVTPILVDCSGISIVGCGNPFSYSCTIEWDNPDPTKALFTFVAPRQKSRRSNGFAMTGVRLIDIGNLRAGKRARMDTTAFRFESERYSRGFQFEVTANYFGTVFDVASGCWGGIVLNRCSLTYNGQVLDATADGWVNEFKFRDCQLHKNGLKAEGWPAAYAIDICRGSNGTFDATILEGMPRSLRARKFHGLRVTGCRFENNATAGGTDPVVLVEDSTGVWFRDNFHRVVPAEEGPDAPPTIALRRCTDYEVSPMMGKVQIERNWEPIR